MIIYLLERRQLMELCINRDELTTDVQRELYDKLKQIENDEYWIFSNFAFVKEEEAKRKLLKYINAGHYDPDDVSIEAVNINRRMKTGVYQFVEWGLIDPVD